MSSVPPAADARQEAPKRNVDADALRNLAYTLEGHAFVSESMIDAADEIKRLRTIEVALHRLVMAIDEIAPDEAREFWSVFLRASLQNARKALHPASDTGPMCECGHVQSDHKPTATKSLGVYRVPCVIAGCSCGTFKPVQASAPEASK